MSKNPKIIEDLLDMNNGLKWPSTFEHILKYDSNAYTIQDFYEAYVYAKEEGNYSREVVHRYRIAWLNKQNELLKIWTEP